MGSEDTSGLLDIYKTAIEMADRVSSRRAGANTFFLTLNTALAALVGVVSAARKPSLHGAEPSFDKFGLIVTAIAGVILALVWWALLRYYRRLNGAKFDVINRLEQRLPAQIYTDEWAILHPTESLDGESPTGQPRWKRVLKRAKHREATVVEQVVPFVFVLLYVAVGLRVMMQ